MHCTQCGAVLSDGAQFCASCGGAVGGGVGSGPGSAAAAPAPAVAGAGLSDNAAGLLAYLFGFISGIIFLVLEPYKDKPFIRFHAWQSIFLSAVWFGLWIVWSVVLGVLPLMLWGLLSLLYTLIGLGFLGVWIWLMVSAYQGKQPHLPILGDLAAKR